MPIEIASCPFPAIILKTKRNISLKMEFVFALKKILSHIKTNTNVQIKPI